MNPRGRVANIPQSLQVSCSADIVSAASRRGTVLQGTAGFDFNCLGLSHSFQIRSEVNHHAKQNELPTEQEQPESEHIENPAEFDSLGEQELHAGKILPRVEGELMSDTMTTVSVEVGMPDATEIERVVTAWFDAAPLSSTYAVFEGDGSDDGDDLPTKEQNRVIMSATRYLWLRAARARAAKP